jgi:GT2 family glycosyltransferase
VKTAIITTVGGRGAHLRRQLEGLDSNATAADQHIVVALDDPEALVITSGRAATRVVDCPVRGGPLPIATARNQGATAALDDGAELLVFLDVDCIPGSSLITRYQSAAARPEHADALLCGPVTYLAAPGPSGYPVDVDGLVDPHPARPNPEPDDIVGSTDYALFWSLSFALTTDTWHRIGGFCERYRGYGGEDTDFACCAAAAGVGMRWVGGAHAFHQYHPVSYPPTEHLHDILRNAEIFYERWGWWPMGGWLSSFEAAGLIHCDDNGRPTAL